MHRPDRHDTGSQRRPPASCTYTVTHTEAGSYDNTAEVTVADNEGNPASDSDDETVTVTDVKPTVELTKSVDSDGTFNVGDVSTFTLTIHNISPEAVTITALTDTNALSDTCQALVGTSIPLVDLFPAHISYP